MYHPIKLFSLVLFFAITIGSCQKEQKDDNPTSVFTINPSERSIVQGKKDGILIIPKNCFVDEQGNPSTDMENGLQKLAPFTVEAGKDFSRGLQRLKLIFCVKRAG